MLSVLDLFRIGLGPSSSHTVGPMRIARRFLQEADRAGRLDGAVRVEISLQGSLALTGVGHGTDKAVMLGLEGMQPETADPVEAETRFREIVQTNSIQLDGGPKIDFNPLKDLKFCTDVVPDLHPNGMVLTLFGAEGAEPYSREYYSTGGGFIASRKQLEKPVSGDMVASAKGAPHPFRSAEEMIGICKSHDWRVDELVLHNEDARRSREKTQKRLDKIAQTMMECIRNGLKSEGTLPGGLDVKRRAPDLHRRLVENPGSNEREQLFDWLNVYAMAVNEENAAGGRVVTSPTNGAAGILPSVMRHYCCDDDKLDLSKARRFLLTAGGIGLLYKQRASISGAEMGCQGEVGVACSMAAGGLAAVWGADAETVCVAAEIGMEHNLGLTCDPVGGLVQIPCIERNAFGAVKAANAARLALQGTGHHKVSLDQVIETMRQTGNDMSNKYKETSTGGLAVNVIAC
ncbi:L-serine ammonia-lyase [Henriciella sp.]|uniref:L-serine ammonia-lyase n=1 Tax=Henriciella sp. TaxID=1968823 RepID=UPI00182FD80E|nr:L-serine ammonia-lyase [Henriciella sp.]HIG22879.1 L-serine ammonia-lyase [Henriciella sp.]